MNYKHLILKGSTKKQLLNGAHLQAPGLLSGTGRYGYEESDLPHAATPFWPQSHGLSLLVAFDD